MDYCKLTVQQIMDLGVADLPEDFIDLGDIMNAAYDENEISKRPFPAIQWSKKESVSIRESFLPYWLTLQSGCKTWLRDESLQERVRRRGT